jgi:hypothetical protein
MRYNIILLSDLFSWFDFAKARHRFDEAVFSNRSAIILWDTVSRSDNYIITPEDFEEIENVFSFMRSESNENILVIRVMILHPYRIWQDLNFVYSVWKEMTQLSIIYLLDLFHAESIIFDLLSIDFVSYESVSKIM